MTHALVAIGLTPAAYHEVAEKLQAAGLDDAFRDDGQLDMTGVAVFCGAPLGDPSPECDPVRICPGCQCKFAIGGRR